MKVTRENFKDIKDFKDFDWKISKYIENNQSLLEALLIDLEELNQLLEDKGEAYRKLYIDYEDGHTEYSPERIDPCPDYYGLFSVRFEKNPYETVGNMMNIEELDTVLCALVNFTEFKLS